MMHIFKIYYLMKDFDKFNTKFWLASATDETKLWFSPSGEIHCSAEILALSTRHDWPIKI